MTGERADCVSVSDSLAAAGGSDRAFGPMELDHLATCLRCRAEQARYQRLMEAMQSLREAPVQEDYRLESQILETLDVHGRRLARWARSGVVAAVGGVAAGAAATAGLIAARHRRAARLVS